MSWQGANAPLPFALGVLAEAPYFVFTIYLFLAFPMGRLEEPVTRWLMAALVLGVLAFFVPWALFSPVIAGGGPLTGCAPDCPGERAPDRLGAHGGRSRGQGGDLRRPRAHGRPCS